MIETKHGSHDGLDCGIRGCSPTIVHADAARPHDIPILPDTRVDIPSPNLIKYQIAGSAGAAARFYQAEMPAHDWVAGQDSLIRPELAVLSYVKDRKRATIIIHQDSQLRTRIMITITQQV